MIIISTNSGTTLLGSYDNVELVGESLICDGMEIPLAVIGAYELIDIDHHINASEYTIAAGELVKKLVVELKIVPTEITSRQAVQQLIKAGLIDYILPALNSIPDVTTRKLAIAEWEKSQVFERNRPLVQSIGGALGLTKDQLDDLFIAAAKL